MRMREWSLALAMALAAGPWGPRAEAGESLESPKPNAFGNVKTRRDLSSYPLDQAKVYVLPIREPIMRDLAFTFHRRSEQAKAAGAQAIVLDIDTPGGSVDSMSQMLDDILSFECPVISFVNKEAISAGAVLALGGDVIVMSDISRIGDAYPILATGEAVGGGNERVEEKILSYMRTKLSSVAKARGHDPDLAQRMTDPSHPLDNFPDLLREEQLLTLDQEQATSVSLAAFIASDIIDALEKTGYTKPLLNEISLTWSEKLAGFMVKPAVTAVLILIALASFYMEAKTPGVGVPLAVGLLAIGLFFWGSLLADLSSYWEIVIFGVGLVLMAVEIFIIPGFGVAGVMGLLCIFGSLLFSMTKLPVEGFNPLDPMNVDAMRTPLVVLAVSMASSIPLFLAMARFLPNVPLLRNLITDPFATEAALQEAAQRSAPPKYVGKTGVAACELRPSGIAIIDDERIDVVTRGEFVEPGSRIRVIAEEGNVVRVAEIKEAEDDRMRKDRTSR